MIDDTDWDNSIQHIKEDIRSIGEGIDQSYDVLELLVLYLYVANKPDTTPKVRKEIDKLIDNVLDIRATTIDDLIRKHFPE